MLQGIILLVLFVALTIAAALLAPKPEFEDARPKGLGDLQVPTADESRSVPIVWGTAELRGPNVLWYGDLMVEEIEEEYKTGWFSSESVIVAFRYYIGIHLLLCYGPLDRFLWFEANDMVLWEDEVSPTSNNGNDIYIDEPEFFGPEGEGGGITGTLRVYGGLPNQNPDPYLEDAVSSDMPAYVDIAHLVWEQGCIGENERLGRWAFRVSRFPNNLGIPGSGHIVRGTVTDGDANPAEVIYEILTNTVWGLQLPPSQVDFTSFYDAGVTLADEGLGFGMMLDRLIAAEDVIKEVLRQIDGVMYEDTNGKLYLSLARADYVVGDLPIFDESNVLSLDSFARQGWGSTFNHINVTYTDRKKNFIRTGAFSQDLANVHTQGREVRADFEYPGVKAPRTANLVARRELRALSFPFATVDLTVNRDGQSLRPGDVIRFYWDELGVSSMVLRILTVDQGELLDGRVKLKCAEDMFQLADTLFDDPEDTGWSPVANLAVAFVDELVRQAPRIGLNQSPADYPDPTLARILSVAKKESDVIVRFVQAADVGTGYERNQGKSEGTTPYGELTADYPKATADIEVSDLLNIDNEVNIQQLSDTVPANILLGQNLAMIEGAASNGSEDEIIGWEELVDEGDGSWTLRNIHRGLCDTQARDHASGAKVWFISTGYAVSRVTYGATASINVKHISKTTTDALDIASATALSLTFNQRTLRPHHPANFEVNSTRLPVAVDETADLTFTWDHRNILDVEIYDADTASPGSQDSEVEYDLEFRHAITQAVLRQTTQTTPTPGWLTYVYTAANLLSDTGEVGDFPLEARMQARYSSSAVNNPPNMTSLQEMVFDFNVDMGSATVQSISLDGSSEYLANTSNTALQIEDEWSLSVWVHGTASGGGTPRSIFLAKPSGGNQSRIELLLTDDSDSSPFQIKLWNSSGTLFKDYSFGSYTSGTWTMLTVTWDGTNLTVYQDGSEDSSPTKTTDNAGTMGTNSRMVIVGVSASGSSQYWPGWIFSPKVWSTELGATEISDIATGAAGFNARANSGNYVSRDTLVHLWDFRTSAAIGQDYGHITTGLVDILTNAVNIDGTDLDSGETP